MKEICEFCGKDPYHYVDIGIGEEAVAIVCCSEKIQQFNTRKPIHQFPSYIADADFDDSRN